jgi:hypothetical protein
LFNLVRNGSTDGNIEYLSNHIGLLDSLAQAVAWDTSLDVKNFAAKALESFSVTIQFPVRAHESLLAALAKASFWTGTSSIAAAMRNQADCASNRIWMVRFPGMLDALSTMALLSEHQFEHVRSPAVAAIERLTLEPSTRPIMSQHEGVMTSLTLATFCNTNSSTFEASHWDEPHGTTSTTADGIEGRNIPSKVELYKAALKNLTDVIGEDASNNGNDASPNNEPYGTGSSYAAATYAASSEAPTNTASTYGSSYAASSVAPTNASSTYGTSYAATNASSTYAASTAAPWSAAYNAQGPTGAPANATTGVGLSDTSTNFAEAPSKYQNASNAFSSEATGGAASWQDQEAAPGTTRNAANMRKHEY